MNGRRMTQCAVVLLSLLAVAIATLYCLAKLHALAFHTRDFPFYLQFAAKAFDPALSDYYALNPSGYNFLGLSGVDGLRGLHQTIHVEPVKLIYALLHTLWPAPASILLFIAALYFAPLPYLALVQPLATAAERRWLLLLALAYVLCPLSLWVIGYDIRPFILLSPTFILAVLAVHYRRPFWEVALFFNLIFIAREEGLLLGGVVIAYNLLRQPTQRWRSTLVLAAMWCGWLLVIFGYVLWAGYEINRGINPLTSIREGFNGTVVAGLLITAGLLAVGVLLLRRFGRARSTAWEILGFCSIFLLLGWQFVRHEGEKFLAMPLGEAVHSVTVEYVASPRFALYVAAFFLLFILLWDGVPGGRFRHGLEVVMLVLLVWFGSFHFVGAESTLVEWQQYAARRALTEPVFALHDSESRITTTVLSDYATFAPFYDYEHIYVYNRLPWALVPSDDRYHPANAPVLVDLVQNRVDWIVISPASWPSISELLNNAQMTPLRTVDNGGYILLQLR